MPLTPQDVRAKLFTSVRFKHGYDEDEVDAFLDQVESDLSQLYGQIDRLTADLAQARAGASVADAPPPVKSAIAAIEADTGSFAPVVDELPDSLTNPMRDPNARGAHAAPSEQEPEDDAEEPAEASVTPSATSISGGWSAAAAQEPVDADEPIVEESAAVEPEPVVEPPTSEVAVPVGTAVAATDSEPSPTEEMLRRTLILAQRTADALITEARTEAETLVADARAQAEQIEAAASLEHATRQRDRQLEHDQLATTVDQLRGFENEYRSRLRAYLHLQLRDLESSAPADPQHQLSNSQRAALDSSGGVTGAASDSTGNYAGSETTEPRA